MLLLELMVRGGPAPTPPQLACVADTTSYYILSLLHASLYHPATGFSLN